MRFGVVVWLFFTHTFWIAGMRCRCVRYGQNWNQKQVNERHLLWEADCAKATQRHTTPDRVLQPRWTTARAASTVLMHSNDPMDPELVNPPHVFPQKQLTAAGSITPSPLGSSSSCCCSAAASAAAAAAAACSCCCWLSSPLAAAAASADAFFFSFFFLFLSASASRLACSSTEMPSSLKMASSSSSSFFFSSYSNGNISNRPTGETGRRGRTVNKSRQA